MRPVADHPQSIRPRHHRARAALALLVERGEMRIYAADLPRFSGADGERKGEPEEEMEGFHDRESGHPSKFRIGDFGQEKSGCVPAGSAFPLHRESNGVCRARFAQLSAEVYARAQRCYRLRVIQPDELVGEEWAEWSRPYSI